MRVHDRQAMRKPEILFSQDHKEALDQIDAYIELSREKGRQRRMPGFRTVLGDKGLIEALAEGFGQACSFCETPTAKTDPGWVHHFRPMGLAADRRERTDFLHYVWLAVAWENLYWCCPNCARAKGNRFFVDGDRGRVGETVDELRQSERAQILDPCVERPRDHLLFRPNGIVEGQTDSGTNTIAIFDLNRARLVRARRNAIESLVTDLFDETGLDQLRLSTSSEAGPDAVFVQQPGLDERSAPRAFAGAATLAMLQWAHSEDVPARTTADFLDFLLELDPDTRHEMLTAFLDGASSDDPPPTKLPEPRFSISQGTDPVKPARPAGRVNLTLKTLPLADDLMREVEIHNFKALRDIHFTLPQRVDDPDLMRNRTLELVPCMLILGENATGKSSVLEAITLALLGTEGVQTLDGLLDDTRLNPDALIHRPEIEAWRALASAPLAVRVGYDGIEDETHLSGTPGAARFEGSETVSKVLLSYGPRRYFKERGSRRLRAPVHRVRSQFDPLATIPNPSDWLLNCPQAQFEAAVRALREVLMLNDDQDVIRKDGAILIDTAAGRTPLSQMSVGYKSVIAMVTDIIQELFQFYDNTEFAHAVVLIDEIETHLHPRWKMRIMRLLRLALPKVQFIVTTHDPLCLRGMYDGEVFVLQRAQDGGDIEQVSDLPSIRGMRAEQLLTSEFFGLGSTDPETDAKLARMHNLVSKDDKSDSEVSELANLRADISDHMAVGNTIGEQVMIEALRDEGFDPFAPVEKVTSDVKRDLLARALRARRAVDQARAPDDRTDRS